MHCDRDNALHAKLRGFLNGKIHALAPGYALYQRDSQRRFTVVADKRASRLGTSIDGVYQPGVAIGTETEATRGIALAQLDSFFSGRDVVVVNFGQPDRIYYDAPGFAASVEISGIGGITV